MTLDLTKRDPNIIKTIIFEIANNNDVALSDIVKNTTLNYQTVKNQINFLFDSGLLEMGRTTKDIKRGKGHEVGDSIKSVKFNPSIQTFQNIAKIFDNKDLSKLMETKYFQDNIVNYLTDLINLFEQNKLTLPEKDYFVYALKNSPSALRFFLIENNIKFLEKYYHNGISMLNENIKYNNEAVIILNKFNLINLFWDNILFYLIQGDKTNELLLNSNDHFADYIPIGKEVLNFFQVMG